MNPTILHGDCRDTLKTIPAGTVQCCVTSPPYWGLRSYLTKGHASKHLEIGQEKTPEAYVETMVQVFREVRRCLHDSGTLWLNIGDSYANPGHYKGNVGAGDKNTYAPAETNDYSKTGDGLKNKDLCMIPWRVALALQADGWWLRSVICWHKKSCMPESVTDRPTNSWEPIFLLAKSQRYFYDPEAVKEPSEQPDRERADRIGGDKLNGEKHSEQSTFTGSATRNQRNVWTLGPEPYSEAHFATFPTEIPRRAILAGTSARGCCPKCAAPWERVVESVPNPKGLKNGQHREPERDGGLTQRTNGNPVLDATGKLGEPRTIGWQPTCKCVGDPGPCTVLDPFGGSGTTGAVAIELGRKAILCELNDAYLPLIHKRTDVTPGLALA
jgi:DNA modification methylase